MYKNEQSAAKPLLEEGSETISQESTLVITNGSADPLTSNVEGDDIVQKRQNKFIEKAKIKFNNKFDYSKVNYISAKVKVCIICPEHGEFYQTPDKHLQGKFGCPECVKKYKDLSKAAENSRTGAIKRCITQNEFIDRASRKYNNKYQYYIENWNGLTKTNIKVICPIHGEFITSARLHLMDSNKYGCPICAKEQKALNNTDSYDTVMEQLKIIYNNYYTYPEINRKNYINKKSKIIINCPKHGEFVKITQKHLSGQGCFKCRIEELVQQGLLPGGYCEDVFLKNKILQETPAYLYYIKINNGQLYKIGISKNHPSIRINSLKSKARKFKENCVFELIAYKQYPLYKAFKIEQIILEEYKQNRIYKKWSTELFNVDIYKFIEKIF